MCRMRNVHIANRCKLLPSFLLPFLPSCLLHVVLFLLALSLLARSLLAPFRVLTRYNNTANVDWTMLQFMQQWFPKESRQKQKENEKEAADEELREMGIDPNQSCVVC